MRVRVWCVLCVVGVVNEAHVCDVIVCLCLCVCVCLCVINGERVDCVGDVLVRLFVLCVMIGECGGVCDVFVWLCLCVVCGVWCVMKWCARVVFVCVYICIYDCVRVWRVW